MSVVAFSERQIARSLGAPAPMAPTALDRLLRAAAEAARGIKSCAPNEVSSSSTRDAEEEFAFAATLRADEYRDGCGCGNSPYCVDWSHRHEDDTTALGRLEHKVRKSRTSVKRIASGRYSTCLPAHPCDARAFGLENKNFASADANRMSNEDFIAGVRSGDIAYLLLGVLRIYHGEFVNITESTLRESAEIESVAQQHNDGLMAVDENSLLAAARRGIWKNADDRVRACRALALDRQRTLRYSTRLHLIKLLREHGIEREMTVLAQILEMIDDPIAYLGRHESEALQRIRSILDAAREEGALFGDEYRSRPWVLDITSDDDENEEDRHADEPKQRRIEAPQSPKKRPRPRSPEPAENLQRVLQVLKAQLGQSPLSTAPVAPRMPNVVEQTLQAPQSSAEEEITVEAVGRSQFCYGPRVFACTSISVNAASTLARADATAAAHGVETSLFLRRVHSWTRTVEIGIDWWQRRFDRSQSMENIDDIVTRGPHAEELRATFDILQFDGSLFAEPHEPRTEAERIEQLNCPDLETALVRCRNQMKQRTFGCAVNSGDRTISLSSHPHGWHVFDSHGSTIADSSVLFSAKSLAAAVFVVKRLLGAEERSANLEQMRNACLEQNMKRLQYQMACFALKE